MDFLKAVSIIGKDLEEAITLLDQLSDLPGSNNAEIELARSRVRSASDLLKHLPELEGLQPKQIINNQPEKNDSIISEKPVQPENYGKVSDEKPVQPEKPILTEQTVHKPVTEDVKKDIRQQKTPEPSKSILADRFSSAGTIGEKISSVKHDEVISSVMHNKPVADIAEAIGINDRFYFIRELFSGDTKAYHDTIMRLNSAASLGEAMKILDESTVMGSDPAAQSSFVDAVRRKFSLNV